MIPDGARAWPPGDDQPRNAGPIGRVTGGPATAKRALALLLVLGGTLSSGSARADARTDAKAHFRKGMRAIAAGRYEDGIGELRQAYEILPHPNVLYNIARAYAESGDLESAVASYRRYLEGNPPDREEVATTVRALEARLERQRATIAAASREGPSTSPSTPGGPVAPGTSPTVPGPLPRPEPETATAPRTEPARGAEAPSPLDVGRAKTEEMFEESVVTASKGAQSPLDAPNSTSIITAQDIRLSGLIQIPDLLRRLAGLDVMETTNAQSEVSMRGFNQALSNKIIVLIDGRSTFVDLIGSTFWAALPIGVEDIERIEVVRGPGSALYGADAFNGVVNIVTKAPGDDKSGVTAAYGDHNLAHGSLFATGRAKEVAYRLSAGFDHFPRWASSVSPDSVGVRTAATAFGGEQSSQTSLRLNGDVRYDLGRGVSADVGAGYTHVAFEIGSYPPLGDIVIRADVFDATAAITSKHFELHAFYEGYRGQHQEDAAYFGQSLLAATFDLNVADAEVQYIDDVRARWLDNSVHVGLGYRFKEAVWSFIPGETVENWESAYIHDELGFGKQLAGRKQFALVGDVRGDYVQYLGKIVPSPKGSLLFHPTDRSTIRGIVATAFRIPTFLEAYLDVSVPLPIAGGSAQYISSNPAVGSAKLNPEQVVTEELGYLNQDSDYVTFDSALFHNSVKNLIELGQIRAITVGDLATGNPASSYGAASGAYPLFYSGFANQCQTYDVYGAELGARAYPADGLDLYANYTLMKVNADTSGCSSFQLANYVPDARTSAHKVNAGVQVRTAMGLDGSVDFNFVSAQDWALPTANVAAQKIQFESMHLDGYAVVNARLGYRLLENNAEIGVIANNLLDNQHREYPLAPPVGQRVMGMFSYRF